MLEIFALFTGIPLLVGVLVGLAIAQLRSAMAKFILFLLSMPLTIGLGLYIVILHDPNAGLAGLVGYIVYPIGSLSYGFSLGLLLPPALKVSVQQWGKVGGLTISAILSLLAVIFPFSPAISSYTDKQYVEDFLTNPAGVAVSLGEQKFTLPYSPAFSVTDAYYYSKSAHKLRKLQKKIKTHGVIPIRSLGANAIKNSRPIYLHHQWCANNEARKASISCTVKLADERIFYTTEKQRSSSLVDYAKYSTLTPIRIIEDWEVIMEDIEESGRQNAASNGQQTLIFRKSDPLAAKKYVFAKCNRRGNKPFECLLAPISVSDGIYAKTWFFVDEAGLTNALNKKRKIVLDYWEYLVTEYGQE